MAELTFAQNCFLIHHKIPLSQVFDATGMKKKEYEEVMKELGMTIAIGVNPCRAIERHTLKDKHGHCVQCKPVNFAFQKRYNESGYIYVARSESLGLTKIGTAKDPARREYSLNNFGYGGCSDWKIIFTRQCNKYGRIEFEAHQALMSHKVHKSYWKQDNWVDCSELFDCEVELAVKTIEDTILQYQ
jgi:hypothetical protein